MNFTKKINICSYGHYDYEALRDNAEMLLQILKKNKFNVKITPNLNKNNINLIYEGHHPSYWKKIKKKLKNNQNTKNYLVVTEELAYSDWLQNKDFTFNQFKILSHKSNFIKYFKLKLLNYFYNLQKQMNSLENGIKKDIFKKLLDTYKLEDFDVQMKDRYLFFLKILTYCDGIISTYDNYNFSKFCQRVKKKYIFIPHLFDEKDFKNKNKNKKTIDVLFTGQINNYRKKLISKIDNKIHVEKILNYKTRDKLYSKSKILIFLSKNNFQNKSSTNRTFLAIKKNIIPLIQKCLNEDQLDKFAFTSHSNDLNININKIIDNYEKYNAIFQKKRFSALKKYNALNFKRKLTSFL